MDRARASSVARAISKSRSCAQMRAANLRGRAGKPRASVAEAGGGGAFLFAKRVTPTKTGACLPPGVIKDLLGLAGNFSPRHFSGVVCAKRAPER